MLLKLEKMYRFKKEGLPYITNNYRLEYLHQECFTAGFLTSANPLPLLMKTGRIYKAIKCFKLALMALLKLHKTHQLCLGGVYMETIAMNEQTDDIVFTNWS